MNSHLYWHDARERHGTGRRNIQPVDNLRESGGFGAGWQESEAAASARYAAARVPVDGARAGGYGGAYGSSSRLGRGGGGYDRGGGYPDSSYDNGDAASQPGSQYGGSLRSFGGGPAESDRGSHMARGPARPLHAPPAAYQRSTRSEASSQYREQEYFDDEAMRYLGEEERALMGHPNEGRQAGRVPYDAASDDLFGRCSDELSDSHRSARAPPGRGRLYIEAPDHKVTYQDQEAGPPVVETGRRLIIPYDNLKEHVMRPVEEIESRKPIEDREMKNSIKEWVETVQAMIVFDKRKWADVEVRPKGCHWVAEAFNERRQSVSREGPTARALAEKLAMMPVAELRFFGLRFAGPNEIKRPDVRPIKGRSSEDNPTLVSPGLHNVLNKQHYGLQGSTEMSMNRKDPDSVQRRYIASGMAHFDGSRTVPNDPDPSALHGRAMNDRPKGDTFDGGIARGIGRGKRHIEKPGSVAELLGGGGAWA